MPRRKTPEQALQRAVAEYLTLALPTPEAWFTTIPAGGGGKVRGAILKGMGYRAGTPDMLVIHRPAHCYHTVIIWLELKSANHWPTKIQKQCRNDLILAGCKWFLCRSLEDVEQALGLSGVPLRATVGGVVGEAA